MNALKIKIVLCLIFTMIFATSAMSAGNSVQVYELKPDKENEVNLKKVELVVGEDSISVRVRGYKEFGSDVIAYNLKVDKENKTYKAKKIKGKELEEDLNKLGVDSSEKSKNNEETTLTTSTSTYMGRVAVLTEDPPDWELARTKHGLYWTSDGTTVSYYNRELDCWAANPSPIDTHWYVSSCKYTDLKTIDGGRTIVSSASSSYYNYDFMDDSLRTDVTHEISIHGYKSGSFDYYWDFTESGESSSFLDTNAYIY